MAGPLFIQTGWPGLALSPNGRVNRWRKAEAIASAAREAFVATMMALPPGWQAPPGRIPLTIHAFPPVKRRRDDDNLISSAKAFRDGIAAKLGIDDNLFDIQPIQWHPPAKPGSLVFELEQ